MKERKKRVKCGRDGGRSNSKQDSQTLKERQNK
jgi:hypothetical protein